MIRGFARAEGGAVLAAIALLVYYHLWGAGEPVLTSLTFAAATWFLDLYRSKRSLVDFSGGLFFCLSLALVGEVVAAFLILAGSYFVRRIGSSPSQAWEILWLLPGLLALSLKGVIPSPPPYLWNALALILSCLLFHFGSKRLCRTLRSQNQTRDASVEERQRLLRLFVLCLSPLILALPGERTWMLLLLTPTLYGLQQMTATLGYRLRAEEGQVAKVEAHKSRRELLRTQDRLGKVSEKRELLERLVLVFEKNLTSSEAFAELTRLTRNVVPYRSIILFRLAEQGRLEPTHRESPEADLSVKAKLTLRTEPLVEKAWNQNIALLGEASGVKTERLLPNEKSLLAIPLKPFGVLYFGRSEEAPFTRSEAGRLVYIANSAKASLLRVERAEHSQKTLEHQVALSRELREKVVYTSLLLEGAQSILASRSREQVLEVFQEFLREAVQVDFITVVEGGETGEIRDFGLASKDIGALRTLLQFVVSQRRTLYLNDLTQSRFASPNSELRSLLVMPLNLESGSELGFLLVGSRKEAAFNKEEHDCICTCGYLMAAGLESISLNTRLKEAHQQVVQASKLSAIGRLAAGVAHELNTPLAVISLALEAAASNPERSGKKLQRAGRALDRARDIVENLLEHSRHSGSRRELISVQDVLAGVGELTEAQVARKKQRLVLNCENLESFLLANKTDIQQVLINLIINSSDASPEGAEISVQVQERDSEILLSVTDQGCGIPAEISDKVFDAFFTTKEVGSGTGLGLSVCRELVQRHQGQISFDSTPNSGTTFTLSFPAMKS